VELEGQYEHEFYVRAYTRSSRGALCSVTYMEGVEKREFHTVTNSFGFYSTARLKPNTHRRRRRDETVSESRRVGVDGVYRLSTGLVMYTVPVSLASIIDD